MPQFWDFKQVIPLGFLCVSCEFNMGLHAYQTSTLPTCIIFLIHLLMEKLAFPMLCDLWSVTFLMYLWHGVVSLLNWVPAKCSKFTWRPLEFTSEWALLCFRDSVAATKYHDQNQLTCPDQSPSWTVPKAREQGRNMEAETEEVVIEGWCLLACST